MVVLTSCGEGPVHAVVEGGVLNEETQDILVDFIGSSEASRAGSERAVD